MRKYVVLAASVLLLSLAALRLPAGAAPKAPAAGPATLVLTNGRIVTVDAKRPEARALAARGDTIVAVGSEADVRPFVGPATRVVDLAGALAVPGLIDSHGHFMGIGEARLGLDLTRTSSWGEVVALVAAAAKAASPGEWIVGRGWHQSKWTAVPEPNVEGFPVHDTLSAVSPRNPVVLRHASGHAAFANARAMELSGVTGATKDPSGGEILRDAAGRPTGLFRETASELLERARELSLSTRTPAQVEARERKVVALAAEECLSKGVTSFHDAGVSFETVGLYRRLAEEGKLGVRLYAMVREAPGRLAERLAAARTVGFAGGFLTVRAIKVAIDGALGSRGAWLLAPYADLPSSTGLETTPVAEVKETARLALSHGYQLCVHAIGDRANRETLDVYEEAFRGRSDGRELRWRIEHAQHLAPSDVPRFGRLGVLAAMQGIHCTSDAPFVPARLGEKRAEEGAYVWRKLLDSGARISNGTDAPVEDVDPIASFHASVTRRTKDGSVFFGAQRMTREEALASYTIAGAYAAFEEGRKGSLAPGKLADVTVLSKDVLSVPEEEILSARVLYTIVGGKVAYSAKR